MRTLRLSLMGMLTFALLGGLGGTVVAQSEEGAGPVTPFTGIRLSSTEDTSDEEWTVEGGIGRARVYKLHETVEWSDPRLPTDKLNVMNFDMYNIGETRDLPIAGTQLLEGPDGYWTGEFTSFCDEVGDCYGMNVITGHGSYEGLFATFRASPQPDPAGEGDLLFDGLIFEGEMPPMPDPIEPSVE